MAIVIIGNIVNGFTHYGPFNNLDDACFWAERELQGSNWEIVELENPERTVEISLK